MSSGGLSRDVVILLGRVEASMKTQVSQLVGKDQTLSQRLENK